MRKFYISDMHFGHDNIIAFDSRPFKDTEEMNEKMIEIWNRTVTKHDEVYILGDLSWYTSAKTIEIVKRLKGKKHLIMGNHDKYSAEALKLFESVSEEKIGKDSAFGIGMRTFLSHHPSPWWTGHRNYNGIHLYGHVHNTKEYKTVKEVLSYVRQENNSRGYAFNVGAMLDYMNYQPRTLEEILSANYIKKEDFKIPPFHYHIP